MNNRYDPYYPTHYRRENIPDVPRQKAAPVAQPAPSKKDKVSVKSWFGSLFLLALPLVNIICLFVWAFGAKTKPSKKTFAAAVLLWMLLLIVLVAVAVVVLIFVVGVNVSDAIGQITGQLQ